MDVEAYKQKAMELLNYNQTYERLVRNSLESCNESSRRKIKQLSLLCPDKSLFKSFTTTNPSLSYFYGLPKVHESQIPLRPILANIGTITKLLTGWLAQQLSPYLGTFSQSHIKSSHDYKGGLISFAAGNSTNLGKMVSLDVVYLFSKVPIDDVLVFIDQKIQHDEIVVPVSRDIFISLLKVCNDGNVFELKGMYFRQRFGIALWSPLSPVMAGLFMEQFQSELLPTITTLPPLWIRYADDNF